MTERYLSHSMSPGPFLRRRNSVGFILLPLLRHIWCQWVVWVWCTKQCLDGEEDSADLKSWRPVAFEDVEADAAELVNVWVVDLGEETNLGWGHWVVVWEEELEVEDATYCSQPSFMYGSSVRAYPRRATGLGHGS